MPTFYLTNLHQTNKQENWIILFYIVAYKNRADPIWLFTEI